MYNPKIITKEKKKRKKPPVQTKTSHSFINGEYNGKLLSKEERDAIIYPLGKSKHKGKGLPERVDKENECKTYTFNFDVRMTHGEKENELELGFALNSSETHTIKIFDELNEENSCKAKGDFDRNLYRIISQTCFILAETCVKNQTEDVEGKRELLKEIIEHFSLQYKKLLGLGHTKIIEDSINDDGMKVEKSIFAPNVGRKEGTNKNRKLTKREIENRNARKDKIINAMQIAKNPENKSELARIIGKSTKTLRVWLKSISVKNNRDYYDLIRFAESGK